MLIFKDEKLYDFEKFPRVSERKKLFKESEGGKQEVCDLVENYEKQRAEEAAEKAARETARNFFENGVSYEVVRASIATLSDEKLQEIYKEVTEN